MFPGAIVASENAENDLDVKPTSFAGIGDIEDVQPIVI